MGIVKFIYRKMSAVSPSYPISAPVEFTVTSGGDGLLCNAEGFTTGDTPTQNIVVDFVATNPSDLIFRQSLGTANTLERLAVGAVGDVLTVTGGAATAQIQTVDTVIQASVPASSYFLLNSPTTGYYVWYDISGTDVDPGMPASGEPAIDLFIPEGSANGRTAIAVDISGDTTADEVAATTRAAIALVADFSTGGATNEVIITNAVAGVADPAADGTVGTTFTFDVPSTPGVSPSLIWKTPTSGLATETFVVYNSVVAGTVLAGSGWVTLSNTTDANVTWSPSVFGGHDAGSLFDVATGVFSVPTTGIWQLSAAVSFEGNSTGNGGGGIAGRRAVRQMRIFRVGDAALATSENQTNAQKDNSCVVSVVSASLSLTDTDQIVVEVRHDATSALAMQSDDETGNAAPVMYFSAHRVA